MTENDKLAKHDVSSSWIERIEHDPDNEKVTWYFKRGNNRTHTTPMTKTELNEFLAHPSKGRWYHANIRNKR